MALRLEIAEFTDANHWRWRLTDADGAFLDDYAVELNPAEPKYQALFDLPGYLKYFSAPDTRDADERRLLHEVGAWIGDSVLGQGISEKILAHGFPPIIVRVVVPQAAEQLFVMPLEIAHARGKPLATQGVSLVFETPGAAPPAAAPVGDRLRLLALFSLPPAGSPLNLRRERQMLRVLVHRLTRTAGLAVELRVLQYGVTRGRLLDALQQGEGWDVVHFSGHGLPGSLILESPDGRPDPVSSDEVAELLRQSGRRLKLVVLSACLSAATSVQQTLYWLGLVETRREAPAGTEPADAVEQAPQVAPTVARSLVGALDCAVVAMRYAVGDEFAMALARSLFDGLFRQQQNLPRATQLALGTALGGNVVAGGALSVATPALFGAKAADLRLVPPRRAAGGFTVPETGLAGFPDEPEHFVGRVAAMTRASASLAAEGQKSGVLFHGMAGAGKTACAVELTYHHSTVGRFQAFVWYRAPEADKDIQLAMSDFALAMERQLPGFEMVHVVDRVATLRDWLPRLIELLENDAVLVVLDNLESLLTDSGRWRDERWGMLIDGLLTPGGLSRAILTSRIRPAGLPDSVEIIPVHALPLDEALLLVRELPNLRRLLDGKAAGITIDAGRQLVRRTLRRVQGHPKLIELAENLAANPERLSAQLDRADTAAGAGEFDAFFREGETRFDTVTFTATLRNWTTGIAGALPEAARIFFHFICALEEGDRLSPVINMNWADLLKRLGRTEPLPNVAEVLAPLVVAGLVDKKATGGDGEAFEVLIHAGVAEAGRMEAGSEFQGAVDTELAATWRTMMQHGLEEYGKGTEAGNMIVRAGLAAFPYLSRRQEWATAAFMLEQVNLLDKSPATLAAILPRARRVVEAAAGTERELTCRGTLARLLSEAGQKEEAEREMRAVIAQADGRNEFGTASKVATDLINVLRNMGRLDEALHVVEQMAEYSRRAGYGPWTQLSDEGQRLQILATRGEYEQVLRRVMELREQMKALSDPLGPNEVVSIWNVRETILDTGHTAALALESWQSTLDLNSEIRRSKQERSASLLELARSAFNDYGPLLRLERYDDARALLLGCREVFERENWVEGLGAVLSGLSSLEATLGRFAEARRFEDAALRFKYINSDVERISISHFNLANRIIQGKGAWSEALAHRLAATAIEVATRAGKASRALATLVNDLRQAGPVGRESLPADFAALCGTVEKVEGVRFREMMERLAGGSVGCDQLLQQVITATLELSAKSG
jgi:tetratricopeptide (TPR) repeat protein